MRLIKHNAIENFSVFSEKEKVDLIIQEFSKAVMLYPQAIADVLDTCKIKYNSLKPVDLTSAVEQNCSDLKMINRIIRISFLVNQDGDVKLDGQNRTMSYRNLMRTGHKFTKDFQDQIKEATLIARSIMKEQHFSKMLGTSVTYYLNMDGTAEPEPINVKVEPPVTIESNFSKEKQPYFNPWFVVSGIALVGGLVILYKNLNHEG